MLRVTDLIESVSEGTAAEHLSRRAELPQRLLRRSREKNPVLDELHARLDELYAWLEPRAGLSERLWSSPEVYAPLLGLGDRCRDVQSAEALLDRLDVVLGRIDVDDMTVADGDYRLDHLGRGVARRRQGRTIPLAASRRLRDRGLVYLPVPGLFADLPFPADYSPEGLAGDPDAAVDRYLRARAAITIADAQVSLDFDRIVGVVALLPPVVMYGPRTVPVQAHWSFNLRLRMLGAIFVNPFSVGLPGLAEALVHEYVHQRMWLWWELDAPSGLPQPAQSVCSPISGTLRPAITMIQALVIFHCAAAVHRSLLEGAMLTAQERTWSHERRTHLCAALPRLADVLCERLVAGTGARRLVDLVCAAGL